MGMHFEQHEFSDPDQMAVALPSGLGKWKLLGRGAFRAELEVVALDRVELLSVRESLARLAHHT